MTCYILHFHYGLFCPTESFHFVGGSLRILDEILQAVKFAMIAKVFIFTLRDRSDIARWKAIAETLKSAKLSR